MAKKEFNLDDAVSNAQAKLKAQKKPGPGGRPTKYKRVYAQVLWDLLEENFPLTKAGIAERLKVTEQTVINWGKDNPEFLEALNGHRNKLKLHYENCLILSAAGKSRGNSASIQFALTNLDPDQYKNRQDFEGRIDSTHEKVDQLPVENMTKERKRALAEAIEKSLKGEEG